ncbi:MAG: hypothetical protein LBB76_07415 [Azoarcus sp.]|jgi:predicted negative regulator of RcsB-dependent stress response|nr:hypothetical protein [Azoarcus sp.]
MGMTGMQRIRRLGRQLGHGMTEYIIIVVVIAIGSIAAYTLYGDVARKQTAVASVALAGGTSAASKESVEDEDEDEDRRKRRRSARRSASTAQSKESGNTGTAQSQSKGSETARAPSRRVRLGKLGRL